LRRADHRPTTMNDPKTKIVATIGPASASKEVLREMMLSGMDVCRLNFSHGSYQFYANLIGTIRELNLELGRTPPSSPTYKARRCVWAKWPMARSSWKRVVSW
jgi:hypothetical protein